MAANRSDIVILDWEIHGDSGDNAIELINTILSDDENQGRLRLITIYTILRNLGRVEERVKETLENHYGSVDPVHAGSSFTKGPVRIVIINKDNVPEDELPENLIIQFSQMINGLLPKVAVSGLAALRAAPISYFSVSPARWIPLILANDFG
jgi:hypothetical protein